MIGSYIYTLYEYYVCLSTLFTNITVIAWNACRLLLTSGVRI